MNSYISGHGKYADLEKEIAGYGLSEPAQKKLLEAAKRRQ